MEVELESPPEFGQLSDSMQWVLSAMRVSCDGSIGDFVWHDEDEDGIQDVGEPGIEGVAITLFAVQGEIVELGTTITDENGAWSFNGLCAGTYLLQIDEKTVPDGLSLTIPERGQERRTRQRLRERRGRRDARSATPICASTSTPGTSAA